MILCFSSPLGHHFLGGSDPEREERKRMTEGQAAQITTAWFIYSPSQACFSLARNDDA